MKNAQREFAVEVVRKLRTAGHAALFAGGCVRDQLLGTAPKDFDVATSALPDQVREVFGVRRTLAIGASFGVITVLGPKGMTPIEVATFRSDGAYSDGRRPDAVRFTSAEEDAQRRDFTINGLFFDPIAKEVIDYVGGQTDLAAKVVRAIGDPAARFAEDKLRMLRAVRFAATLEFALDGATLAAIQTHAAEISQVSAERIGAELKRMLLDKNRARALELLEQSQLAAAVLPEYALLSAHARAEARRIASELGNAAAAMVLAALLPVEVNPTVIATRLRWTRDEGEQTAWLLRVASVIADAHLRPWPQVQRVLAAPWGPAAVALQTAKHGADDPATRFCVGKLALPAADLNPPALVSGADLIAAGLAPGPKFGQCLEQIRDAQLLGFIATAEEATDLARRLALDE